MENIENNDSDLIETTDTDATVEATEETEKEKAAPAWEAFAAAITAKAQALGLGVEEQRGFVKVTSATNGHKIYLSKGARAVKRVDTSLPVLGQAGTLPLEKPNGKIECHLQPDLEVVSGFLAMMADENTPKIRTAKRAPKAADAPAAE